MTIYPLFLNKKIMETIIAAEPQVKTKFRSTLELSIRQIPNIQVLPGDDNENHTRKVGSFIKGTAPGKGLTLDEEEIYLPSIIGKSPNASDWGLAVNEYWNNIAVVIPPDSMSMNNKLPGRPLSFVMEFATSSTKSEFDNAIGFADKGEISKRGKCVDGISDFILFRHCLVYSRVAKSVEDIPKSRKIIFYLYSRATEVRIAHTAMEIKLAASNTFAKIIDEPAKVNGILRMFNQLPEIFEGPEDKHMALFRFVESEPAKFIKYANDKHIIIKSVLLRAKELGIVHNPENTQSYYYGTNNEIFLGPTLDDAVLWWISQNDERASNIKDTIKAQLKEAK